MKTLVIGGAGFIGRHLTDELLATGREVVVVGRKGCAQVTLPEAVVYRQGDIKDRGFIISVLQGVDEIVDLAYSSVPKTSYENPVQDIMDNLPGSVALFEIACGLPIRKFLFVSSGGTIYGEPEKLPIVESHPTNPISPYGITKLALEKYAQMYHRIRGLPIVNIRPSNPYGEGQRPFVGQGFVATAIGAMLAGQEIKIFGTQGTIRDYIYVRDAAKGLVAALDFGVPGEAYNIGSSVGRTNLEVIQQITAVAQLQGVQLKVAHLPPRSFDVSANVLSIEKLFAISGWRPETDFAAGIERTWNWCREAANKGFY